MNTLSKDVNQNDFVIDEDDLPIGRILSRREILALLGTTGAAAFLAACAPIGSGGSGGPSGEATTDLSALQETNAALPSGCIVRPALTEGPVFVEEDLNRSDIRVDPSNDQMSEGVQLDLTFNVSKVADGACMPLAGVQVDVWHCDADGIYSDTTELGMNSVGQKFLRGYQVTDENGMAHFTTIYPGWYEGRAVHIHFKMRTGDGYDFTSQLFFDDALSDEVFANAPYNTRGERKLRNADDGIYGQSGGQMLLAVNKVDAGFAAAFDVALDLT
ncbi:MAG: intradiol ring-cleavage dioxygenase [Caldilineaceae bacterium]